MAKKKVSDTIAQQRKARKDFLELKKMQTGEMEAGPKPSEIAVKPKTFGEKWKNYWFHYKWQTFGSIFAIISLAILITQCAGRTDWDMKVVYFTYSPVVDQQLETVSDYLEGISKDLNGDGEVNIQVVNYSTLSPEQNYQHNITTVGRLQTIMAVETDALLYITDEKSAKYFQKETINDFFGTEQHKLGKDFYQKTKTEDFGSLPKNLQIACRRIEDTTIDGNKHVGKIYKESINILEELKKN